MQAEIGLKIRLFGPMEVRLNGRALPGLHEHRKAPQLLALLALYANKPIGNEWLATQLWPDLGSIDNLKHTVLLIRA
jgi:DNA-binding SARP family transcriptional activator